MQADNTTIAQNLGSEAALTEFFQTIWPAEGNGIYALMTLPDRKHHKSNTVAEAVAKALALDNTPDVSAVYHACATYRQASYQDASGKTRFRTQENVQAIKAAWFDIDCGADKAAKGLGYETPRKALEAITAFIEKYQLPSPTYFVLSGHGWHLYWAFTKAIAPDEWHPIAVDIDALAKAAGLLVDPSRTKDCASVLRPPGTTNRKNPNKSKLVKASKTGELVSPDEFSAALSSALAKALPFSKGTARNLGTIVIPTIYPPSDVNLVADRCAQIRQFRETGCDDEPTWHKCLGVVKHCTDGDRYAHEWSTSYDGYEASETQAKLDAWVVGPATCETFRSINPDRCAGCLHTCKSPIQLGVTAIALPGDWLTEMNATYAYINRDATIYRVKYRDFITPEKFNIAHANKTVAIASGNSTKHVPVSQLWIRDKDRRQHEAIVTRPGEPEITSDNCLNDWAGFSVTPRAGNIRPFQHLYSYLFGDEQFPLRWLAHLVQHPGTKMFVALVVWSQAEGVGKNLLFETIGALFNHRHYALIGQSEVDDDFCGWIPGAVFVVADEVRASKSDKSRDRLKLWQTSTTLRTHDKGQPKREAENLMNMVFLSNHADGMFLSDYDRRFYVHEVKAGQLPETIKHEVLAWRADGGLPALLHYLQQIDLAEFEPKGRAPLTASKREMIEASRSDLDRWAYDVVSGSLPVGREVATGEELARRFFMEYPNLRQPPSVATVVKVLVRTGAVRRDNQIRLTNGRKVRALALIRHDYWKNAPESAWRDELEKRP